MARSFWGGRRGGSSAVASWQSSGGQLAGEGRGRAGGGRRDPHVGPTPSAPRQRTERGMGRPRRAVSDRCDLPALLPSACPPPPPCVTGSSSSSSSSKSDSGRSGSSSSGGVFSSIGRAVTGAMSFGLSGFSWVANGASWVGSLFSRKKTSGKSPKRPYDDFSTPGGPNGCAQRLCPTAVGLSFARGHTSLVRLPPLLMRIVPPLSS